MNRRPRIGSASERMTAREGAFAVLDMLDADCAGIARKGPAALDAAERELLRSVLRERLFPGGVPGRWPLDLALLAIAHDAPSLPGDSIEHRDGKATRRVDRGALDEGNLDSFRESPPSVAPSRRTRPSLRAARMMLRGLVSAVRTASGSADAFKCVALIVMLHRLDRAAVFGGDDEGPHGRARVAWLARRIEDVTRSRVR